MESLEAPVLFGPSRLDAFGDDTQLDPPYGQRREAAQAGTGEGRAVVGADNPGKAVLAEGSLQDAPGLRAGGALQPFADEEVAGRCVLGGERVYARPVARTEPSLEVDGPDVVGAPGVCEGLVPWGGPATAFASLDQTGPVRVPDAVLGAGHATSGSPERSQATSFLGPHEGWVRFALTMRSATSLGVALAWRWGARLRSRRPFRPWAS